MKTQRNKVPRCETNAACGMVADTIAHYGLSQAEVARAMKVSPGLLSDIAKGKKGLSAEFALRFEECLGVSAEWLLKTQAYHDYCSAYHQKADVIAEVQPIKLTA
jgi:addiction module HigA family antidote